LRLPTPETIIDIIEEGGGRRSVPVNHFPYRIGRSGDGKNELVLDDARVSRQAASISLEGGAFFIEDMGQRRGLFLNGHQVEGRMPIKEGDVVTFGNTDSLNLVFRGRTRRESLSDLLSRMDTPTETVPVDKSLRQLNLLLVVPVKQSVT
jgi:pSer/pThr/pTyr-binding forkhead associated (FHA) protein